MQDTMATAAIDTFQADVSNALSCLKLSSLVCYVRSESCYNNVFVWQYGLDITRTFLCCMF